MAHEAGRWWELCLPQAFQLQQELAGLTTAPAEGEARSPPSLLGGSAGPRRFRRAFPWELLSPTPQVSSKGMSYPPHCTRVAQDQLIPILEMPFVSNICRGAWAEQPKGSTRMGEADV